MGYVMWALWSINERLAGGKGGDLPEPDSGLVLDLIAALVRKAEEAANA